MFYIVHCEKKAAKKETKEISINAPRQVGCPVKK